MAEDSTPRVGVKHDERMGNLPYCAYCGFGLVTDGPRECCAAGYDVDRLLAQIKSMRTGLDDALDKVRRRL